MTGTGAGSTVTPSWLDRGMTRDDDLFRQAAMQYGALARWQARRLGLTRAHIDRRVLAGHWVQATERVLRRTGAPESWRQRVMIAVLDAGPDGGVGSFETAGAVWELPGFATGPIEVTQTRVHRSREPSFGVLHRPVLLLPSHITVVHGIPVTTIGRTIFDLAGRLKYERIERIAERVIAQSPGTLLALHALLEQLAAKGRPGIASMRKFLATRPPGYVACASGLELRFRKLGEEAGVRDLRRQVDLGGHDWIGRVDFCDELKLIYEVDSILHHTTPGDSLRDEERDKALKAAGFADVVRIPEEWIWHEPCRAVQAVVEARRRAFSSQNRAD